MYLLQTTLVCGYFVPLEWGWSRFGRPCFCLRGSEIRDWPASQGWWSGHIIWLLVTLQVC